MLDLRYGGKKPGGRALTDGLGGIGSELQHSLGGNKAAPRDTWESARDWGRLGWVGGIVELVLGTNGDTKAGKVCFSAHRRETERESESEVLRTNRCVMCCDVCLTAAVLFIRHLACCVLVHQLDCPWITHRGNSGDSVKNSRNFQSDPRGKVHCSSHAGRRGK